MLTETAKYTFQKNVIHKFRALKRIRTREIYCSKKLIEYKCNKNTIYDTSVTTKN